MYKYFPNLTDVQVARFEQLFPLYCDWNKKINVISRKDIENLYPHHVLHSLAIAKILNFRDGTEIVDVGTGGGFPAIPLAVFFPNVRFHLVDSVSKKIRVATEIAREIGLNNCTFANIRMEEEKGKFDFVVSRAAMPLFDLVKTAKKNIAKEQRNSLPNGIICLKGGELRAEIAPFKNITTIFNISDFFSEEYFLTKKAIYVRIRA
jgi:16S rRNA (guanine527-N7)-methyltransferase